jgi:hypothetical protein
MQSLLEIFSPVKGPSSSFAANHPVRASSVQGNYTFAIVAIEYFIKWIEVKPITNISSVTIKNFFWKNINCRYGIPREITIDNAKKFDNDMFKDFCHQIGMKVAFASVYHPQSNGEVERANSIKKSSKVRKRANGSKLCRRQYVGQQISHHSNCCLERGSTFRGNQTHVFLNNNKGFILPQRS